MTEAEEAKVMVNLVYQPTGYLNHKERPGKVWLWSKDIAKKLINIEEELTVDMRSYL